MKNFTRTAILIAMIMFMFAEAKSANDSLLIYMSNGQQKVISLTRIKKTIFEPVSVVTNPAISLSKSLLIVGDTLKITGTDFSASKTAEITIKNPDNTQKVDTVAVSSGKGFVFNYPITSSTQKGTFSVFAKDIFTSKTTSSMNFEVRQNYSGSYTMSLSIIEKEYGVGEILAITWLDSTYIRKLSDKSRLTADKTMLWWEYQIEYSLDSGKTWKSSYESSELGKINQVNKFYHWLVLTDDYVGDIQIRIKDLTDIPQGKIKKEKDQLQEYTGRYSNIANPKVTKNTIVSFEWCVPMQINQTQNKTKPYAVAADGVSPILIRIAISKNDFNNINIIKCSLSHTYSNLNTYKELGYIAERKNYNKLEYSEMNLPEQNRYTSLIKSGVDNKEYYDFWYIAPADFTIESGLDKSNQRKITANIYISYKNGNPPFEKGYDITIVRPPLMLVHGLNSDNGMWGDYINHLSDGNMYFNANHTYTNFGLTYVYWNKSKASNIYLPNIGGKLSLEDLSSKLLSDESDCFYSIQKDMTNKQISSIQVDYVSHSMGSLMLRQAITKSNYYSTTYTLGQGFVYKMISIDSPHNGSYNANLLQSFCTEFNKKPEIYCNSINGLHWERRTALEKMGIIISNDYKSIKVNDAINDLNVNSPNNNFKDGTIVKNHLIASDLFQGVPTEDDIKKMNVDIFLDKGISALIDVMKEIHYKGEINKEIIFENESDFLSDLINMNLALKSINGYPSNWLWHSDMIVGTSSQLAGKTFNLNSTDKTFKCFSGLGHTMVNDVCKSSNVWDYLDILLNSKMSDGYFAPSIPATNFTKPIAPLLNEEQIQDSLPVLVYDTTKAIMTVDKNIAVVGDVIEVTVNIPDTTGFKFGYIDFQYSHFNLDTLLNNYKFYIPVTNFRLDTNYVTLFCRFDFGDTLYNSIQSIPVLVKTQDSLLEFSASEKSVNLILGDDKEITYKAYFQTFITEVFPYSISFNLQINDTTILGYDLQKNKFTAKKYGSTMAIATYLDKADTTYFYIDTLVIQPKIDKIEMTQHDYFFLDTAKLNYNLSGTYPDTNKIHFLVYDTATADSLIYEDSLVTNQSGEYNFAVSQTKYLVNKTYYVMAFTSNPLSYSNLDSFLVKPPIPIVTTNSATGITTNSAISGGNVTSDRGFTISERGICWSIVQNPTIDDNKTTESNGLGEFISYISGLQSETKYYARSFATNIFGTGYGEQIEFTTKKADTMFIALTSGWNIISSNITPQEPDSLQYVTADIIYNLVIAKNNTGNTFIPSYDINDIGKWDVTQGYQVYMSNADTLVITGLSAIPSESQIILNEGWNMIAYLRNTEIDCETAFASLAEGNLIIVKDNEGRVYIPSYGINTIGNLIPGQGYQIYVLNADVLVYPGY